MKHQREDIDFDIIDRDEPDDSDLDYAEDFDIQESRDRHIEIMEKLDKIEELLASAMDRLAKNEKSKSV